MQQIPPTGGSHDIASNMTRQVISHKLKHLKKAQRLRQRFRQRISTLDLKRLTDDFLFHREDLPLAPHHGATNLPASLVLFPWPLPPSPFPPSPIKGKGGPARLPRLPYAGGGVASTVDSRFIRNSKDVSTSRPNVATGPSPARFHS